MRWGGVAAADGSLQAPAAALLPPPQPKNRPPPLPRKSFLIIITCLGHMSRVGVKLLFKLKFFGRGLEEAGVFHMMNRNPVLSMLCVGVKGEEFEEQPWEGGGGVQSESHSEPESCFDDL